MDIGVTKNFHYLSYSFTSSVSILCRQTIQTFTLFFNNSRIHEKNMTILYLVGWKKLLPLYKISPRLTMNLLEIKLVLCKLALE